MCVGSVRARNTGGIVRRMPYKCKRYERGNKGRKDRRNEGTERWGRGGEVLEETRLRDKEMHDGMRGEETEMKVRRET